MKGFLRTQGWVFKLQPKTTEVGKHKDSDLCLLNGGVEEHHAVIEWSDAHRCYVLSDLNSAHGTYVNDCRIHNASVRLAPGDQLHFGYGGSTYELSLENASPLPLLGKEQGPVSPSWTWGDASLKPRPPVRTRPISAGGKRPGQGHPSKATASSQRPGSGPSVKGGLFQSVQSLQHLLQEKEERLLRLEGEVGRLNMFHVECIQKDHLIAKLQGEVSALTHRLSDLQTCPDVRLALCSMETEINHKSEQIQQLREQMVVLQASGEEVKQAVTEKDLKISGLRALIEKLRNDNSKISGLVSSLQSDLATRERQALKLSAEVDRLRQDVRHKDAQLGNLHNKISTMKENKKQQEELFARENEVYSLKKDVEKLVKNLGEKENENKILNTERNLLKNRLQKKTLELLSLQAEVGRVRQQQQVSEQKKEEVQTELQSTQSQLEGFRTQIVQAMRSASQLSVAPEETPPDQQVLEEVKSVLGQKEVLRSKMQELEEKLQKQDEEVARRKQETQALESRLEDFKSRLQESDSVDALQKEISALHTNTCACTSLDWVMVLTHSLLITLITPLQEAALALKNAGIDVPNTSDGVAAAIRVLWQQHQDCERKLQHLQVEFEALQQRETGSRELLDKLSSERQEMEREKQQVTENESRLRLQSCSMEAEFSAKLEQARQREEELKISLEATENRLQEQSMKVQEGVEEMMRNVEAALEKGAEEERERYRKREEEYREEVQQHTHTIEELRGSWNTENQKRLEMEIERDALREQLRENSTRKKAPPAPVDDPENMASLRALLVQSQQEVASRGGIIAGLSRDLAHTHARISDMTGELSEQQKLELERHRALAVDQRVELSTMTQKLSMMSQLVEQKDAELKEVKEELRLSQGRTQKISADIASEKQNSKDGEYIHPALSNQSPAQPSHPQDVLMVASTDDLSEQGSKCRGGRHEEVIRQQQEVLSEMRRRIKALEINWQIQLLEQQGHSVKQELNKKKKSQNSMEKKAVIASMCGFPLSSGVLSEVSLERSARLDMTDALELSERTYMDLARVLCEALEMSEEQLTGCSPMRHLTPREREKLGSLRDRDLELLRTRLALQHSLTKRTQLQLQESQREMHTLRENQGVADQQQAKLESVCLELQKEREESALLREELEHSSTRLETICKRTTQRKAGSTEKRAGRAGPNSCEQKSESTEKLSVVKRAFGLQEKLRKREFEVETLKKQLRAKEEELACVTSPPRHIQMANPRQSPSTEPCAESN
ncbi:forkhead-associated domain-containing protein 1 isoform X2 [Denticeps clupeoides]|uniref:FHA domain-containing protein n=1 Tax=Denticeps clupeoides TaxID=299321 RepID=A0AAY4BBP4_9TELE|nr:forkhead-associated domain-containing protein 1 isoform X2 [Denticeps clupeoides]